MYTTKQQRKNATRGKTWWTRVKAWWNNQLNPDHDWLDYDAAPDKLSTKFDRWIDKAQSSLESGLDTLLAPETFTSLINSWSGAHLTGSQIEANQMSMQNAEDIYQRQVTGMQNAGLNPALMYQNGAAGNAPVSQGQQGSANMSDLVALLLADKQGKLLEAQTRNTDAQTDKTKEDTLHMKLINEYYPDVTETQINQALVAMGLDEITAGKILEETKGQQLQNDILAIQKIIEKAKSDNADGYYSALREYEEASTEKVRAEKAEIVIRKEIEILERDFMKSTNTRMGSSTVVALASALGTLISNFGSSLEPARIVEIIKEKFKDFDGIDLDKILDWIDKPKNAPWVKE